MSTTNRAATALLSVLALASSGAALAQHEHGDVEVGVENGQLTIENGLVMIGGGLLFESEFGELGNPFGTDEPGFELDDGLFNTGEILAYQALGSMQFWDGSAWTNTVPDDEHIIATDPLGSVIFNIGGVSGPGGVIGAADDEGGVHDHIEFEIANGGAGDPAFGAYLIELALFGLAADQTTEVYGASSSMFIAFNYGLDHEDFEMAVDALVAPIPIPGAALLMLSGLVSIFGLRRRSHT